MGCAHSESGGPGKPGSGRARGIMPEEKMIGSDSAGPGDENLT
jgi:hypothetical protein